MTVSDALEFRRAVPSFVPEVQISREEIDALIDRASLAPSSMNMQPWKFILCHTAEEKELLKSVSYNQPKIAQASAVIVVLGDLKQYENAPRVVQFNIEAGYYGEERREGAIAAPRGAWENNPGLARDEAFRGCSLWSMAFMLAAAEDGWATAPMSGFVPDQLTEAFGVPDRFVPVMLIAIGKANPEVKIHKRSIRFPASELVHPGKF